MSFNYSFFLSVLFCIQANAQFNKADIDSLKSDLKNYADSGCKNNTYLKSSMKIVSELQAPISSSMTPDQAKTNDQLRASLAGVREALASSMIGDNEGCPQKLRDGLKKLDELPLKKESTKSMQALPSSSGASK